MSKRVLTHKQKQALADGLETLWKAEEGVTSPMLIRQARKGVRSMPDVNWRKFRWKEFRYAMFWDIVCYTCTGLAVAFVLGMLLWTAWTDA